MGNKQEILDLLLPVPQPTTNLCELIKLEYIEDSEIVVACFKKRKKYENVVLDSGTSMIRDVLNHII